jgi:hypothetical protein
MKFRIAFAHFAIVATPAVLLLLMTVLSVSCIGCGGSSEPTVIQPTETFHEDADVAAAKAAAAAKSAEEPL